MHVNIFVNVPVLQYSGQGAASRWSGLYIHLSICLDDRGYPNSLYTGVGWQAFGLYRVSNMHTQRLFFLVTWTLSTSCHTHS